jgi:phage protein D/phage baseplate assembly protein gpV
VANETGTPTILIADEDITPDVLGDVDLLRVEQSIHCSARAELRLVDVEYTAFDNEIIELGDALEIKLPTSGNAVASVFDGVVVEVGIDHDEQRNDAPILVVVALDAGYKLDTSQAFLAYLERRPSAVVQEIADRHRLNCEVDIDETADLEDPYLLQASTDREALDHLAQACGCEWFVAAGTLHFRPRPALDGPELIYGEGLLRFSARFSGAGIPESVTVRGWDMVNQSTFEEQASPIDAVRDAQTFGSDAPFVEAQYRRALAELAGPRSLQDQTVRDQSEARRSADAAASAMVRSGLHAQGLAIGNADIVAGGSVTVARVGSKLAGTYYLTHVTHEFGARSPLRTRFAIREEAPPAPAHAGSTPTADRVAGGWSRGLVLGKVSNLNDPEKAGRVKVAFPALGQDVDSDWARVVSVGAGEGHGFDNRPALNEEVVVGFERGDPRFPLVFGGLWSKKFPPPVSDAVDGANGVVAKRVITSQAGHAITISDGVDTSTGDAERYVSIVLSDGTELHVGEDGVRITTDGLPITFSSGEASITLTDDGKVEIEAKEFSVKSQQDTTIEATGNFKAKGNGGVTVETSANAQFKGGMVKVEGQSMTEVKGGMVKLN